MGEEGGNAADGADLALEVEQRHIALGRGVEFQDARNAEALLEFLPDVGAQAVAAAQPQPVCALALVARRIDQIAGELADILDERAIPIAHVVPESMGGEFLADEYRAAARQQRRGRNSAADAVIHRQAVIHAVLRRGVHQAAIPEAPLQQPPMADICGLRQAGSAGGVDQQRAVGDRHGAALFGRQPLGRQSPDRAVDARERAVAVRPDFRPARKMGGRGIERGGQFVGNDDMLRRDDVDAMGERGAP